MRRKNFKKQQDDEALRRANDDAATAVVSLQEIRAIISRLGRRVRGREMRRLWTSDLCVNGTSAHASRASVFRIRQKSVVGNGKRKAVRAARGNGENERRGGKTERQ